MDKKLDKKTLYVVFLVVLAVVVAVFALAPKSAVSENAASESTASDNAAPENVAPESAAPESAATENVATETIGPEKKDPERVLARVEGQEIKEKDVDQVLISAGPQVAMMYDNERGRKAILDDLVASRLFALYGKKQGLDNTPEFQSVLDNFINQTLARSAMEEIMKDVVASDEECKGFYDGNLEAFTTPDEIRVSHILLADDETSADKTVLIQNELKNGAAFDALAVEHSIDPSVSQGRGDIGFFSKGQMVPEFEAAAFELKEPGDISEFIKSSYGWHVIKLEEKRPSTVMAYDEVKPQLEQYLTNEKKTQRFQDELEALKKEYKVEMLIPDTPAP